MIMNQLSLQHHMPEVSDLAAPARSALSEWNDVRSAAKVSKPAEESTTKTARI
jgi:hypothetical protein